MGRQLTTLSHSPLANMPSKKQSKPSLIDLPTEVRINIYNMAINLDPKQYDFEKDHWCTTMGQQRTSFSKPKSKFSRASAGLAEKSARRSFQSSSGRTRFTSVTVLLGETWFILLLRPLPDWS